MFRRMPAREVARRLPRLIAGLLLAGTGIALMVRSDLGLSPWDVFHQGISNHTGIPIGTVGIVVGLVVLLAWIPLHERYGVGTLTNVILIGVTIDVLLAVLPDFEGLPLRLAAMAAGIAALGPASGLYIGVHMGAGPRDGLMTNLADRGYSVRRVRTTMEIAVLIAGFLLGGTVGIGTVVFAATIGPNVHYWLERLSLDGVEVVPEDETPTSVM